MCVFSFFAEFGSYNSVQRIMGYIESGKAEGATVHLGGDRFGTEGFYIKPTIFTNTNPEMKIVKEEIFGPVGVVIKFEDEDGERVSKVVKLGQL